MNKYDYIVAIDPDSDKSGLAIIKNDMTIVASFSCILPELIDMILSWKPVMGNFAVYVEASWLNNRHNWHNKYSDSRAVANAKGYDVGRNHQAGKAIVEMLRHHGIEVIECQPLRKCWKGHDGKITHEELSQFVSGLPNRTNQEVRDAVLLAWEKAGFPIRIKPIQSKK